MMEVFSVGGRFPTTAMRNTWIRILLSGDGRGVFYRHVEHSRDPQCDLLSWLAGHHEDKERDHVDQEGRQDVVHHVESCPSPDHDIVPAVLVGSLIGRN